MLVCFACYISTIFHISPVSPRNHHHSFSFLFPLITLSSFSWWVNLPFFSNWHVARGNSAIWSPLSQSLNLCISPVPNPAQLPLFLGFRLCAAITVYHHRCRWCQHRNCCAGTAPPEGCTRVIDTGHANFHGKGMLKLHYFLVVMKFAIFEMF